MNWVLVIVVLASSNPISVNSTPPLITTHRFITESACNEASSHVVKNTNPKAVFTRCIKDA